MRLKEKVAIITGATSGIGRETAILFGREGAKVVAVARRVDEGKETIRMIKEAGGDAIFIKADVSVDSEVKAMVEGAIKSFGKIDILLNNVGINPESGRAPLVETPVEAWDLIMNVNVKGIFLTSRHVLPHMVERKGGSVINTSSNWGVVGAKNRCAYVTSKGAIITLTKSMAVDYAPFNIRVNALCPTAVETGMATATFAKLRQDKNLWKETILNKIPLGRTSTAEEVAYASLFLASDESSFITGTSFLVDGGYTAQ
jgi:NAD(P)-dependent dehydrogenase (short-subunit alcohol dehydrogenase family)